MLNRKKIGSILVTIPSAPAARTLLPYVQRYGAAGQMMALQQFIDGRGRQFYLRLPTPDALARGLALAYVQIDWTGRGQPVELQPIIRQKAARTATDLLPDLDLPIEELDLAVRPYNKLKAHGVNTVGDLVGRTEADLLGIRNFGQKSVDEVKMKLTGMGLTLKQPATV